MTTPWEIAAIVFAVAYLLLAIRQNAWCWPMAIASTSIYVFLMAAAGLYMESALQVFYIGVAIYGWRTWLRGDATGGELPVTTWPRRNHVIAVIAILAATAASGWLLSRYTAAALPYADSFTTWGAIIATWMVARKILENWHYWFVIDSVSVYLYVSRELLLTAGLFGIYLVLIVIGYQAWRRSMARAGSA